MSFCHRRSDNSNLLHTIRLTEDTLSKIHTKMNQSKLAVNKYKTEAKNNSF